MGMGSGDDPLRDSDPEEEEGPFVGRVRIVDKRKILELDSDEEEVEGLEGHVGEDVNDDKENDTLGSTTTTRGTLKARECCNYVCPECRKDDCSRPVQELLCGHVKCRRCFIASEEACKQCLDKESASAALSFADKTAIYAENAEDKREVEKQKIDNSGKILVEVERASGVKSFVNVSLETLHQLGLHEVGEDEDESTTSSSSKIAEITENLNERTSDYSSDDDRLNAISEGDRTPPSGDLNAPGVPDSNEEEMNDDSNGTEDVEEFKEEIEADGDGEEAPDMDHTLEEALSRNRIVDEILSGGDVVVNQILSSNVEFVFEGITGHCNDEEENIADSKEELEEDGNLQEVAEDPNFEKIPDSDNCEENIADSKEEFEEDVAEDPNFEKIPDGDNGEENIADYKDELEADGNLEEVAEDPNFEKIPDGDNDEEITGDLNEEDSDTGNGDSGNYDGQVFEMFEIEEAEQDEGMLPIESISATNHSNNDIVQPTSSEFIGQDPFTSSSSTKKGKKRRQKIKNDGHIIQLKSKVTLSGKKMAFKCLLCTKEFTQKFHRQLHIYCNPANGKNPYTCSRCSKSCLNSSHLEYHIRSQHTGERPYACKHCNVNFCQQVKLNRHMLTHCANDTKRKESKPSTTKYSCAYCTKKFNELASCKRHLAVHTEDRPFQCTICQKTFKIKGSLDAHIKLHSMDKKDRAHKCPDCTASFAMGKDLRRHALQHSGEFPFECTLCNSKCRRKDNFERHLRNTHQLPEPATKIMSKEALEKYQISKKSRRRVAA